MRVQVFRNCVYEAVPIEVSAYAVRSFGELQIHSAFCRPRTMRYYPLAKFLFNSRIPALKASIAIFHTPETGMPLTSRVRYADMNYVDMF